MSRPSILTLCFALTLGLICMTPALAGVMESASDGSTFPSSSDFQTFNPHDPATPTASERTVRENGADSRQISQTFQLDSAVTIDTIDIMFVRGGSGNTGILRIFDVADTLSDNFTTDAAGTPLLDIQFTMPAGLDPASNIEQTLRLDLTGADEIVLPAKAGPAGYMLNLSAVVDGDTAVNNEIFTWRFGEGATDNADSPYVGGQIAYDDFVGGGTEMRRDGLFALNGALVPEPAMLTLLSIGLGSVLLMRRW